MADDLSDRGAQDRARISLSEAHEVDYGTKALRCSEQELREAVSAVGVSAKAVRAHLAEG